MVAASMVGASGIAAACTRPLTAVAPASTAAEPNKFLREIIVCAPSCVLALMCAAAFGWRARHGRGFAPRRHPAAHHSDREVHGREPKIALRLNAGVDRSGALPHFREQP